jgi:hypothetical protein
VLERRQPQPPVQATPPIAEQPYRQDKPKFTFSIEKVYGVTLNKQVQTKKFVFKLHPGIEIAETGEDFRFYSSTVENLTI